MHNMNLRRIREARGLKQEHLAEMIGVNTSTISRAESMHPSAKLETYQKCAAALGLELADLFTEDLDPVIKELSVAVKAMPKEQRETVLEMVRLVKAPDPTSGR